MELRIVIPKSRQWLVNKTVYAIKFGANGFAGILLHRIGTFVVVKFSFQLTNIVNV